MVDFVEHMKRQIAFSKGAFGPGTRTEGVIDHIRKELLEIEEALPVRAAEEWIDVVILALDGLWREIEAGKLPRMLGAPSTDFVAAAVVKMIVEKQAINEGRRWPDWRLAEPGKAIEHVRGESADGQV